MSDFISRLRNELAISSEDDCTQFAKDIATACDEVERLKTERDDYVRELQSRIAELETRIERMTSGLESIEHTATDLQDPVKQLGPTVNKAEKAAREFHPERWRG